MLIFKTFYAKISLNKKLPGYDVTGLDNIPETGPALFVAYHGTLPIDIYYLISKVMVHKRRTLHVVGDKFVFKIPGMSLFLYLLF